MGPRRRGGRRPRTAPLRAGGAATGCTGAAASPPPRSGAERGLRPGRGHFAPAQLSRLAPAELPPRSAGFERDPRRTRAAPRTRQRGTPFPLQRHPQSPTAPRRPFPRHLRARCSGLVGCAAGLLLVATTRQRFAARSAAGASRSTFSRTPARRRRVLTFQPRGQRWGWQTGRAPGVARILRFPRSFASCPRPQPGARVGEAIVGPRREVQAARTRSPSGGHEGRAHSFPLPEQTQLRLSVLDSLKIFILHYYCYYFDGTAEKPSVPGETRGATIRRWQKG